MKIILGFFSIVTLALALESPPIIRANEDLVQTGSKRIYTGSSIIDPSLLKFSEQSDLKTNVTLSFKKPKDSLVQLCVSLQDLNIEFGQRISFKISSLPPSNTEGFIQINWGRNSSILRLRVRFIVFSNEDLKISQPINLYQFNQTTKYFIKEGYENQNAVLLLSGLKIINSNFSYFDIDFELDSSFIKVLTKSNVPVQYDSVNIILLTYKASEKIPFLIAEKFTLALNNLAASYNNTDNSMTQSNTFWGLTKFGISLNQSQFFISSNLEGSRIDAQTNQANRLIVFSGLVISFEQCSLQTPFYLKSNNTCFDVCPFRYLQAASICKKCSDYDCFRCQQDKEGVQVCSQCSAEIDFRILNNITQRCDPLEGYYDDGNYITIAQRCNQNCRTCDGTSSKCTSCHKLYVLNGDSNKCEACPATCLACTSRVVCTLCQPEATLIKGQCNIQKTSNVKVVASATTSLILCCSLVAALFFHKQNKEWNKTNEEKQQRQPFEENNNQNQMKKVVSTIIQNQNSNLFVINNPQILNAEQSGYVFYQRNKRRRD